MVLIMSVQDSIHSRMKGIHIKGMSILVSNFRSAFGFRGLKINY